MSSVLVTGTSKGLGLAFVRQLVALPSSKVAHVFATVRSAAPPALVDLANSSNGRVTILHCEVTDDASVSAAAASVASTLGAKGLDVLINNVGICEAAPGGVHTMDNLASSLNANVLSAHRVTTAFLPLLRRGALKKVANISTTLASITDARSAAFAPVPAYKISKAALNALTVQYALEFEKEGFAFIALSPGWLKTELGGGDAANLTPDEGARASLDIIFEPGQAHNGQFPKVRVEGWEGNPGLLKYDGSNSAW